MGNIKKSVTFLVAFVYYGLIPVAVMPSFAYLTMKQFDAYTFPYPSNPFTARHTLLLLLLPGIFMLYAVLRGRYAYQGIWAAFLAVAMMWKFSHMPFIILALITVVGACAVINFLAFQKITGAKLASLLKIRFGGRNTTRQLANSDGRESAQSSRVLYPAVRSPKNFASIVGMSELKERLLNAGKAIVTQKGARNGILLTGEPGNGKTAMAEALAGELTLPLISVAYGELVSKWVGETTERVMKVFDDAERQAPCVLFIDEAEALLVERGSIINADSEAPKTVSAALKRIVDLRTKGVVLIAATNHIDRIDKAAIREGRFDFKIEVLPPDSEARVFLLGHSMKDIKASVDSASVEKAAIRWEGFPVSRIIAVGNEAVDRKRAGKISRVDFDELMNCLRATQASRGTPIPETALTIEQLVLDPVMRKRLNNLALRMINIERVEEMGGSVPRGVLFYGPAGTGKTIGAMALAKTVGWSFLATTGSDLLESDGEIDKLVAKAKDLRPCIVFIDEADDVLADRRMSPLSKRITNKLITAMDGTGGRVYDVLYIAATNAPDLIDEAALRGGRFTEKVGFNLPDEGAVREYVKQWMEGAKMELSFTLDDATQALMGQSLANIKDILQGAVNIAVVSEAGKITFEDLLTAQSNLEVI